MVWTPLAVVYLAEGGSGVAFDGYHVLGVFIFIFIPMLIAVGVFAYHYGRLAATCSSASIAHKKPVRVMTLENSGESKKTTTSKITRQEPWGRGG